MDSLSGEHFGAPEVEHNREVFAVETEVVDTKLVGGAFESTDVEVVVRSIARWCVVIVPEV